MNNAGIQFNWQDVPLYPTSFKPAFARLTQGTFHLSAGLGHSLLLGIFIFFFLGYGLITAVLFYHWHTYGMKNKMIYVAEIVFGVVSSFLFIVAFQLI